MNIIGNQFLVDFGMAKAILHFQSETSLTFTITEKDGNEVSETETVAIKLTELRPQLYMATWKEKNGNTITQVQDYENEVIYSNWTLPGGEFNDVKGDYKASSQIKTKIKRRVMLVSASHTPVNAMQLRIMQLAKHAG